MKKNYIHLVIEIEDYSVNGVLNFIGIVELSSTILKKAKITTEASSSESAVAQFFPGVLIPRAKTIEKNDVISVFLPISQSQ